VEGQGVGRPVAFTRYDMQSVENYSFPPGALTGPGNDTAQTDCPKFSVRQEWAENWRPEDVTAGWTPVTWNGNTIYVAQYSYEFNTAGNFSTVVDPAGRVFRTDFSDDGLTQTLKTYASLATYPGAPLKTTTVTYGKDNDPFYTSNLRVID